MNKNKFTFKHVYRFERNALVDIAKIVTVTAILVTIKHRAAKSKAKVVPRGGETRLSSRLTIQATVYFASVFRRISRSWLVFRPFHSDLCHKMFFFVFMNMTKSNHLDF